MFVGKFFLQLTGVGITGAPLVDSGANYAVLMLNCSALIYRGDELEKPASRSDGLIKLQPEPAYLDYTVKQVAE